VMVVSAFRNGEVLCRGVVTTLAVVTVKDDELPLLGSISDESEDWVGESSGFPLLLSFTTSLFS